METFVQIMIAVCGCSAIWLVSRKESWSRWGYIIGLIGQPFWIYTAWQNDQTGILILTIFYAYSWSQGIYFHWIKIN